MPACNDCKHYKLVFDGKGMSYQAKKGRTKAKIVKLVHPAAIEKKKKAVDRAAIAAELFKHL